MVSPAAQIAAILRGTPRRTANLVVADDGVSAAALARASKPILMFTPSSPSRPQPPTDVARSPLSDRAMFPTPLYWDKL